ncbi:MAG: cytosine/creatinine deaminase, partial [Arthrobacter pascens]|nr:cytosine/creatinine deaminase [Arthrobacter pascens]
MSALRAAGRQKSYQDTTLYTTLAPCAMCPGTIIQFKIPRVVVGEARTFDGKFERLRSRGVEVVLDDQRCVDMTARQSWVIDRPTRHSPGRSSTLLGAGLSQTNWT